MKVLFVGNSHTFTHDVPSIINKLFIENNEKWEYKEMTVSGQTLKFHSTRNDLLEEIKVGNYDIIILQERASNFEQELFNEGFNPLYDYIINNTKSNILMYMIWSNESRPEVQKTILESYVNASNKDRVSLASAGIVWDIIRHNHKDITLYMDGNHATKTGAYLAASTLFYALTNRKEKLIVNKESNLIKELELKYENVTLIQGLIEKVQNSSLEELENYLTVK